jgi:hypothetical protein
LRTIHEKVPTSVVAGIVTIRATLNPRATPHRTPWRPLLVPTPMIALDMT